MYRIAIVDQDADAREEPHRLAAAFFEERGESAAFIICDNTEELPEHYDCYLRGNKNRVQLQCTTVSPQTPGAGARTTQPKTLPTIHSPML